MPLEGHFERVNTPLRKLTRRERNVLVGGLIVTAVALLALILGPGVSNSRPAPEPGCIYTVVAGRTGGEPVHGCGANAEAICARSAYFDDPRSRTVGEACREAGIAVAAEPSGTAPVLPAGNGD